MFLSIPGLLWLTLAGCEPPPTSDLVSLEVTGQPVEFDTFCDGNVCAGNKLASSVLAFDANVLVSETGRFEVQQFRIDYDIPDADIPFYAETTWAMVLVGTESPFNFRPAGEAQRDRARNSMTGDKLTGTATISLAGYDHRNEVVETEATFDIVFRDILANETTGDDDDDDDDATNVDE